MKIVIHNAPYEQVELVTQLLRRNYHVAEETDRKLILDREKAWSDDPADQQFVRHLVLDLAQPTGDQKKVSIAKQLDALRAVIEAEVRAEYAEKLDRAETALEEAYKGVRK